MKMTTRQLGPLKAHIVDTQTEIAPTAMVVLCHGFGAPGNDLVGLAREIATGLPAVSVRFIFPEAPLDLAEQGMWGARAWWHIDMIALQRAMARGEPRILAGEEPPGLAPARRALTAAIDVALTEARLPMARLCIGGFSQGAMLATDTTLRLEEAPARLFVCSGTLLAEETWRRKAPTRAGLKAVIAHGHEDALLPFAGSVALRDLLTDAGWSLTFLPFSGGHTISQAMVSAMTAEIAAVAAETL